MAQKYPPNTRAANRDRETTAAVVDAAFGDGQLNAAEHRAAAQAVAKARTLDELAAIVADLQGAANPPSDRRRPPKRPVPWFAAATVAAALVVGVGAYSLTHRDPVTPPSAVAPAVVPNPEPLVIPTPFMASAEGIALLRDRLREKFGSTVVDEITFNNSAAYFSLAVPGQPNRKIKYSFRGGFTADGDPESRKIDTATVDLDAIDLEAVRRNIEAIQRHVNVPDAQVYYISYTAGEEPLLDISAKNSFGEGGFVNTTSAGELVRVYAFTD
ncbi:MULTISPECIES: DUF1707 SHOCT-like domain-containing protein [Rhodococcus]|jgi:hypothetical protein|uniref:DUF1707 domain-containing protein n=1 Tax=Rhodococcus erythropolis TaxID=1833 RepID=A0A401NE64_RHOER|nr:MULTISPECIES: DUF1707 domain-containing protein [Rhodococcus]AGT95431.1 hypothetical protein O5Y_28070 [Rhodococcus erythropolis CCM2595]MBH5146914.1 DUF1707 domain-containing protein [Rhodococcus erythropolis]MBO8149303.1 DUF1707 domain-containing protein [Rhodococcus erythropolis]MDF2897950.1 hypothetical protein [Rhodococcus erythropolis]MDI9904051.1 DUF1707 domain-containing protein [Rhodococcus sp. IEGM 1406]